MFESLKRYLGLGDPYGGLRAAARLSEDEARSIAETETGQQGLLFAGLMRHDDGLIWSFRTPSVGSWLIIRVHDGNGKFLGTERQGKR